MERILLIEDRTSFRQALVFDGEPNSEVLSGIEDGIDVGVFTSPCPAVRTRSL